MVRQCWTCTETEDQRFFFRSEEAANRWGTAEAWSRLYWEALGSLLSAIFQQSKMNSCYYCVRDISSMGCKSPSVGMSTRVWAPLRAVWCWQGVAPPRAA